MQLGYLGDQQSKGWFQVHELVNIRATLHILKWSQLGGRTILIQDEAGCEAASVPGIVSYSDHWHDDEMVGSQN